MTTYKTGNLLDAPVEALVNVVNTVGVMGKGIAGEQNIISTTLMAWQKFSNARQKSFGQKNRYDSNTKR